MLKGLIKPLLIGLAAAVVYDKVVKPRLPGAAK